MRALPKTGLVEASHGSKLVTSPLNHFVIACGASRGASVLGVARCCRRRLGSRRVTRIAYTCTTSESSLPVCRPHCAPGSESEPGLAPRARADAPRPGVADDQARRGSDSVRGKEDMHSAAAAAPGTLTGSQ